MIPFKVFSDLKSKYPLFLKLRKLEVGIHGVCGCSLLQDLLESSPHLETLVLKFVSCPALIVFLFNSISSNFYLF